MTHGPTIRVIPTLALGCTLAACSGAAPSADAGGVPRTSAPLDQPFVDADTGQALGSNQELALNGLARGASAGTLLARSQDGAVCVFANGREGWNRAAC